ncbi:MAG: hypothetical protein LBU60_03255 [Clostridiales bacterium]|nr:hypothetical protein [Clostridiales bacterium]
MNNIYTTLNQSVKAGFNYYGLATSYEVTQLINNGDKIAMYFQDKDCQVNNLDDFIDFLFLKKSIQFKPLSMNISQEKVDVFNGVICDIEVALGKYKKGDVYRFLEKNIENIIQDEQIPIDILSAIIELIPKAKMGLKKTLKCVVSTHPNLLLCEFDKKYKSIIDKDEELFCLFFNVDNILQVGFGLVGDEINLQLPYLKIIKRYYRNKIYEKFTAKLDIVVHAIADYGIRLFNATTEDNAINTHSTFKEIKDFLCAIASNHAKEFVSKYNQMELMLNGYLQKHGSIIGLPPIDLKDFCDALFDEGEHWINRMLMLTHNGRKHYYSEIMEQKLEKSIVNMPFSSDFPINDYFTEEKQRSLQIYNIICLNRLSFLVNDEHLEMFYGWIESSLLYIIQQFKLDISETEAREDLQILFYQYDALLEVSKDNKNKSLISGFSYGAIMFTFALTEKLLRLLYNVLDNTRYKSIKNLTMNKILKPEDPNENIVIREFLGEHETKCLAFYLLKDSDGIGKDLRNKFAHYGDIKSSEFDYHNTLQSLQLYLDIIGISFVKALDKKCD